MDMEWERLKKKIRKPYREYAKLKLKFMKSKETSILWEMFKIANTFEQYLDINFQNGINKINFDLENQTKQKIKELVPGLTHEQLLILTNWKLASELDHEIAARLKKMLEYTPNLTLDFLSDTYNHLTLEILATREMIIDLAKTHFSKEDIIKKLFAALKKSS